MIAYQKPRESLRMCLIKGTGWYQKNMYRQKSIMKANVFVSISIVASIVLTIFFVQEDKSLPLRENFEAACKSKLNELYADPQSITINQFQFSYVGTRGSGGRPPGRVSAAQLAAYYNNARNFIGARCSASLTNGEVTAVLSDVDFVVR